MRISLINKIRIFPNRIWQQIFVALILLVVVPLTILGLLLIKTSRKAIQSSVLEDRKNIATQAAGRIKEHFDSAQQALIVTASMLGTLYDDPWRQETAVVELSLRYPAFKDIAAVNVKGLEYVTSQLGSPLKNRSEETVFREAMKGRTVFSDVFFDTNNVPLITIATPIRRFQKVSGVLMADFNLKGIWDVVDSIKLGKTGQAYLIDQKGRVIVHPDKKIIFQSTEFFYPEIARDVLSGGTSNAYKSDRKGFSWILSYAPVPPRWGFIIAQSKKEAYAISHFMQMESWTFILFGIIAAILVSLVLSKIMSRPMNQLMEGTRRVAGGNLDQLFRIKRKSDIGKLLFSFNRMIKKLREARKMEKLSAVGSAAATIAHELKNSLVLVDAFIRMLPERHKDKKFIREFSDTIPNELDSWNRMLRNMMELPKQMSFSMEEISLREVVENVVSLVKHRIRQDNIQFFVSLGDGPSTVIGNKEKLKQAFLNLLTNSIEATPYGGTIRIESEIKKASSENANSFLEIRIINTGQLLSREAVEKIFNPFYTTKDSGLGIGLYLSKEIIRHHNGRIEVFNRDGHEVVFSVFLPALKTKKMLSV